MRPQYIKALLFLLFLFVFTNSEAQVLDNIFKKVKDISGKTRNFSFEKTAAISTSIKDTLYGVDWFDEAVFVPEMASEIGDSKLRPGYYRSTIRSYCLKAGVYGPTKGDGYQIAKLKGSKAKLIHSILRKSVKYPNISQSYVQTLIWGIEAGVKFSKYPITFQKKVKPLLTKKDILFMRIDFDKMKGKVLPDKVKSLMNTYALLREKMQNTQLKYDEIEAIAVKNGAVPLGIGSKNIHKGIWSYIGNGFFLRAFPKGYATTDIELYRPEKLNIIKDEKGRIATISGTESTMKIIYDNNFGADVFDYGYTQVPVWKIKKLYLQDIKNKKDTVLDVNIWMFRGSHKKFDSIIENHKSSALTNEYKKVKGGPSYMDLHFTKRVIDKKKPSFRNVYERYEKMKKWYKKYKELEGYAKEVDGMDETRPSEDYLNEDYANKRIYDGLKSVSNPTNIKGRSTWIRKNLKMTMDLVLNAVCTLGDCNDNTPLDPDLSSYPAQPGNTNKQRIGLSQYKK